jgi:uncharacterized protein
MGDTLRRGLKQEIEGAWRSSPVVVLEGLRAVGKTTLVGQIVSGAAIRDLNESSQRALARNDLQGWVEALPRGVAIDEAQLVPDLQLAIKRVLDHRGAEPGQFLLTGSARLANDELGGSDPLAGRARRLRVHPFAQCEIERQPRDVVSELFGGDPRSWQMAPSPHADIIDRAARGGFPLLQDRAIAERIRTERLDDYVAQLFTGDVYATGRNAAGITRLFRWIVGRSGTLRNINDFVKGTEFARDTVTHYLDALHRVNLIERVPGYRPSADKRETDRERLFAADPAFVAAASSMPISQLQQDIDGLSALMETFVATELLRLMTWSSTRCQLFHWRESDRHEVDLVIEDRDGGLIGIEVKSARVAVGKHFDGLRAFRNRYRNRFRRGFVVHSGDHSTRFEDDLWALPFSALWSIGDLVGDRVSSEPSTSSFDRLEQQIRKLRTDDELVLEAVGDRIGRLDSAFDHLSKFFERMRDAIASLGLTATITPGERVVWQHPVPPAPTDEVWRSTLVISVSGRVTGFNMAVVGRQLGDGTTMWLVDQSRAERVVAKVGHDADHGKVIDGLLDPVVEDLPAIVADLRRAT